MSFAKRSEIPERIMFDMTPMIDCCFQLIIFFMLSLRIFSAEGDFNVKMPRPTSQALPNPEQTLPIQVRMRSNEKGELTSIQVGDRTLSGEHPFEQLRRQVRDMVGDDRGPGSVAANTEVVLDCDYNLRYEYVIAAITAATGYVDQGKIIKIVENIKFAPRRASGP